MNQSLKIATTSFGVLFAVTLLAGLGLAARASADDDLPSRSASTTASVTVSAACTFSSDTTGTDHSATLTPGQFTGDIGGDSDLTVVCNNSEGYAVYAVGYYNNTVSTVLTSASGNIATGTTTSGDTSYWSMKLAQGDGDKATIVSPYNAYASVPGSYTKVATYGSATTGTSGTSFTATYGAYIASGQTPDTYKGGVKYTVVNPAAANAPTS